MAKGWEKDGAVQEQIDASVEDAVSRARSEMAHGGESLAECAECGDEIPEARRRAVPGVRLCVECQSAAEAAQVRTGPINRRGNKDSQLR